ncbi:MAG: outer membrane beta-barrel protein, partial [Glaciecola sp.]
NWFLTGQFGTLAEIQYDETDQNLSDVIGNKVKDSLPWNLGVGYQWNDWLATKAEYWSFSTARGVTSISSDDLKSAVQQLILRNTALVGMSIHSSIPLNSKVTLDLEAGHYEWQSNVFINYGTQDPLTGAQLRGTALRYGAGFSYLARPNLKLNLMFNEFQIHQLTQSTIMLGLSYRFGDTSSQPIYNKQTSKITALNADMVMQLPKAEIDSTLDSNAIRFASDSVDIAETDIERLRRLLSSVPLGRLVNIELKAYAQKHAINHYEKVLSHVRMVVIKSVIESFYPDTVPVVTRQYHINSTTDVSTGGRVEVILNLLPE